MNAEDNTSTAPSFAAAANETFLVVAVNTTITVTSLDRLMKSTSFEVSQVVQTVALFAHCGRQYFVAGGDSKLLQVFEIPSDLEAWSASPVFVYGPHSKRIVHVAGDGKESIVFADKFGEVYRIGLERLEKSGSGSSSAEPAFLLQHFSLITCMRVTARTLITCDRDCHVRISCYPATYDIDSFLWSEPPQAMKLCIEEVDGHLVTGDSAGRVHLWQQAPTTGTYQRRLLFTAAAKNPTGATDSDDAIEFANAITSIVNLTLAPEDGGVSALLCTTHSGEVVVILLDTNSQGSTFLLPPFGAVAHRGLALRRVHRSSCVAITRGGAISLVQLRRDRSLQVSETNCDVLRPLAASLVKADLVAHFASSFVDPREQRDAAAEDGGVASDLDEGESKKDEGAREAVEGSATKKKRKEA